MTQQVARDAQSTGLTEQPTSGRVRCSRGVLLLILSALIGCADQAEQAESLIRFAGRQQERGHHQEAIQSATRAIALQPDRAEAWFVRGNSYAATGRSEDAVRDLQRATALRADWDDAWYALGVVCSATDQPESSLRAFSRALDVNPWHLRARFERSQTLVTLGRTEEALHDLQRLLTESPDHRPALLARAPLLLEEDPRQVIADMSRVIAGRRESSEAWFWRGLARSRVSDDEQAIRDLGVSCRLDPSRVEAWRARSRALVRLQRVPDAIADLQTALQHAPRDADSVRLLANLLLRERQFRQVTELLADPQPAVPLDGELILCRARALAALGDADAAARDYADALQKLPSGTAATVVAAAEHARVLFDDDQPIAALAAVNDALAQQPQNASLLSLRADIHRALGHTDEALEDYTRVISENQGGPAARFARARLYLQRDEPGAAEADLSAVLDVSPGDVAARELRAEIRERCGDTAGTLADLNALLDQEPDREDLLLRRAQLLSACGKTEDAEHDLRRAVERNPGAADCLRLLVTLRLRRNDSESALRILDSATTAVMENDDLRLLRGTLRLESGRLDAALADSAGLLSRDDPPSAAWLLHGRILFRQGNLTHSVECLNRAERLAPWDVVVAPASQNTVAATDNVAVDRSSTLICGYNCGGRIDLLECRGQALAGLGQLDQSLRDLSLALQLQPTSLAARLTRARVCLELGRHAETESDCNTILDRHPDHAEALRLRARCFFATERCAAALDDLKQLTSTGHNSLADDWIVCQCLAAVGSATDALRATRSLVSRDPQHAAARRLLATLLEKLDDPAAAAEQLAILTDLQPQDAELRVRYGRLLHRLGRFQEAAAQFTHALEEDGENAELWYLRGLAEYRNGRPDRAARDLDRALELDDRLADAWYVRGNLSGEAGALVDAEEQFRRAVAEDPRHAAAWYNLGNLLFHRADYRPAIDCWTRALAVQPTLVRALNNRAAAWTRLRQFDQAVRDYEQAIDLQPEFARAHDNLAWLLATCDDRAVRNPARAVAYAERACELTDFRDWSYLSTLAAACAEAGQLQQAADRARAALVLAPNSERSELQRLVELYERQATRTGARTTPSDRPTRR